MLSYPSILYVSLLQWEKSAVAVAALPDVANTGFGPYRLEHNNVDSRLVVPTETAPTVVGNALVFIII